MKSKFAGSPNQAGGIRNTFVGGQMVLLRHTLTIKNGDFRTARQRELGTQDYVDPILKSVVECTLTSHESLIYKLKVIDSDKTDGLPNLAVLIFTNLR